MAVALPDDSYMELGTVYSETEGVNRKVQTWMKDTDGKKVGEKKLPQMSIFNKRTNYKPMFTPPSPKKTQYKSVLNRDEGRRYAEGKYEQDQQHSRRHCPSVRSKVPVTVSYDPKEHTLKRRAQRANQALKEYQNAKSPTRNKLRKQRDEAMEENNNLGKENAIITSMLSVFREVGNPFHVQGRLHNLESGCIFDTEVETDLRRMEALGLSQYEEFSALRIQSNEPNTNHKEQVETPQS